MREVLAEPSSAMVAVVGKGSTSFGQEVCRAVRCGRVGGIHGMGEV